MWSVNDVATEDMAETQRWVFGKKEQINGISSVLLFLAILGKTNKTAVLHGFLQNRTQQKQRGHNV